MTKTLLALGAAAVAAAVTRRITTSLVPRSPLLRRNHRGVPVATGLGVAVLTGFAAGMALVAFVHAVAASAPSPAVALSFSLPLLVLGFAFGMIGLYDDLAAQPERGWRSHVPDLIRGRVTPGALKIIGGGVIAFVYGAATASSFGWAVAHAAVVALTANLFNGLDVRPGRAAKFYLIGAIPLAILAVHLQVPLAATLGAVAGFLSFDLRERAMLGDAGSNAIGAILGAGVIAAQPAAWLRLSLLGLLVGLTAVAEGPTLSVWIDRIGPLRQFDRAGRAPGNEETARRRRTSVPNAGTGDEGMLR